MASKVTLDVGYDVEVIAVYPPELNCGICCLIIKDAVHGCQNHVFCDSCIRRYVTYDIRSVFLIDVKNHAFCDSCIMTHVTCGIRNEGNVICPGGCREIIDPTNLQPNHYVDRMIKTIKTKCANESCSWKGDLLYLVQTHQINCAYKIVACVNKGCLEMIFTKDLMQHDEVCLYKLIPCDYCYSNIIRRNKKRHQVVCLEEETKKREYQDIGCSTFFCRKNVHSHEINQQSQHTRLIYVNFNSQLYSCNKELANYKDKLLKSNREVSNLRKQNIELKESKIISEKTIEALQKQLMFKEDEKSIVQLKPTNQPKYLTHELQQQIQKGQLELYKIKKQLRKPQQEQKQQQLQEEEEEKEEEIQQLKQQNYYL